MSQVHRNPSDYSSEAQFQILSHCPHRKIVSSPRHTLPSAGLKTSGTQSYHVEDAGLRSAAQTSLEGTHWEEWEWVDLFSLASPLHLFLVYLLFVFTPAGIPWGFYIILELKLIPECPLLPGSTDIKTYSPPASVDHRCPVVCLYHTVQALSQ